MAKKDSKVRNLVKNRKVVTVTTVIISIVMIIIPTLAKNVLAPNSDSIEVAYYVSQILSALFVITGTVIAVWQYYLTSKSNIKQMQLVQVQKAIDLSEYYKDNILHNYTAILYVYREAGILAILKKIKSCDMIDFDKNELEKLLSEDDIKRLEHIQHEEAFARAVLEADTVYNLNLNVRKKFLKSEGNSIDESVVEIETIPLLASFVSDIINETLNSMEFFAMHFCHNTADATVVYRSLHQSYIKIVQGLYYSIAKLNTSLESKYYTNVIKLYRDWYKKNEKEVASINANEQINHGTVIEN